MKKKIALLIGLAALLVLIIGAYILYDKYSEEYQPDNLGSQQSADSSAEEPTDIDYSAPDFTVLDSNMNPVSLSDLFGKPIEVTFWASWCPNCLTEMPHFEEAYKKYGDEIHFVMLNATDGERETLARAQALIEKSGYTFPVYYDTTMEASITYYTTALPMTFFINADGDLVASGTGSLDPESLQRGIDMILP